ncbi:hypothetical protein [Capsulimonas corticalis]|uniref:hypothetical protein n=1 Tax=Capsulimonas corticalis TaxID=2219043 RepID=UPI000F64C7C9|nr:hypothetical protein [Capsulimonas corticalis]
MKFNLRSFGACCALAALATASFAATAAKPTGPISLDYKHLEYSPTGLHLYGGVEMKSAQYLVNAGDILVVQAAGAAKTIKSATATPLPGAQVSLVFQDVEAMKSMKALADKAVITPDPTRRGGARIDLTGNVQLEMNSQGALDGPSKTTLEKATILIGEGPTYPRIEGEHGHTTLTPQF